MKKNVVQIEIKSIVPTYVGAAVFLGNEKKSFVINIEQSMGETINMFLNDAHKERPLTHDLMLNVFKGFGIEVMYVIISELKDSTYYARLFLKQQNELGTKLVELDARPSDCLALASSVKCPIFITAPLFEEVEDMSRYLKDSEDP
jgi:bifunctional DNase/RNase